MGVLDRSEFSIRAARWGLFPGLAFAYGAGELVYRDTRGFKISTAAFSRGSCGCACELLAGTRITRSEMGSMEFQEKAHVFLFVSVFTVDGRWLEHWSRVSDIFFWYHPPTECFFHSEIEKVQADKQQIASIREI